MCERKGLAAIALTTDTSILTAVGNDYGYDAIFSRQVEALASPQDIIVAYSTSGNSSNVLAAVKTAKAMASGYPPQLRIIITHKPISAPKMI